MAGRKKINRKEMDTKMISRMPSYIFFIIILSAVFYFGFSAIKVYDSYHAREVREQQTIERIMGYTK